MKVRERLLGVFGKEFGESFAGERTTTQSCSSWDSLGHIKLLIAIETEFGFEPSPEDVVEMYSDFRTIERVISKRFAG